ncbi:MAG TPA: PEPxxWA-CTERM sorting domain-containing protein [Rhizomicrobium sp.]
MKNSIKRFAAACLILSPVMALAAPSSASAANIMFSGGVTGTDPLGGTYTAGPNAVTAGPNTFGFPTWGETVVNNGGDFPTFSGTNAVAFIFTYTGSAPNSFNTSFDIGMTQIGHPEGQAWDTVFLSPTKVEFMAPNASEPHPAGLSLTNGDQFDILVGFNNPIDPSTFSFTGEWVAGVPEPASWALLLLGFGAAGIALRRRRHFQNTGATA